MIAYYYRHMYIVWGVYIYNLSEHNQIPNDVHMYRLTHTRVQSECG